MSLYIFDVEADGPAPGLYSMVSLGIVRVDREMKTSFKITTRPISEKWVPGALAVSNITREQHEAYPDPEGEIKKLAAWVAGTNEGGRAQAMSDNPAFDWQWLNYYMHRFHGDNPFGFSARRIGDIYSGAVKDFGASSEWKKLRRTKHTHDPVDDAMGNVEAFIEIVDRHNIKGVRGLKR